MKVFDMALNYLAIQPRTEKEVRDYLKKKEIRKDLIDETLDKLKYYKYIDDFSYAKNAVEFNKYGKRLGREKLKYNLKKKGISKEILEKIDDWVTDEDHQEFIRYHYEKAFKKTEGKPYKKRFPKIANYLAHRGFSYNEFNDLLYNLPKDDDLIDMYEFEKHFNHYVNLYKRKQYSPSEFRGRLIKGMLSRGYSYDLVKERLKDEDF